jgi:hypothetical protein
LLSKADKLTRQEQALSLRQVQQALNEIGGNCTCQLFSSLKKSGVGEAEAVLSRWLGLEVRDEAAPIGLPPGRTARPKKRSAVGWSARHGGNSDKR